MLNFRFIYTYEIFGRKLLNWLNTLFTTNNYFPITYYLLNFYNIFIVAIASLNYVWQK